MGVNNQPLPSNSSAAAAGAAPARAFSAAEALPLDHQPRFVFLAHPARWDVFEGPDGFEILPAITKLEFQAGLAGVRAVKGVPDGDPSFAIVEKQRRGWVVVPESLEVVAFGERRTGYVHVYDGRAGKGTVHLDVWQRPYLLGGAVFFAKDKAGYVDFLRKVKATLPPMDPNIRAALQEKFGELLRVAKAAAARGSAAAAVTVGDLEKKLGAFRLGKAPEAPSA